MRYRYVGTDPFPTLPTPRYVAGVDAAAKAKYVSADAAAKPIKWSQADVDAAAQ